MGTRTIRTKEETDTRVFNYQKKHRLRSYRQAIEEIVEERERLEKENADFRAKLENHKEPQTSENATTEEKMESPKSSIPQCQYCAEISNTEIECSKDFSKKGKVYSVSKASCQKCWERREFIRSKQKQRQSEEEPKGEDETETPSRPIKKPEIKEIVNQSGVCRNPLIIRQTRPLTCIVCGKRYPWKKQACDEIAGTLKTSPLARRKFFENVSSKHEDLWLVPRTEEMSLEEIEKELGLYNPELEKIHKLYAELCLPCEWLRKRECHKYCSDFLKTLREPQLVPLSCDS